MGEPYCGSLAVTAWFLLCCPFEHSKAILLFPVIMLIISLFPMVHSRAPCYTSSHKTFSRFSQNGSPNPSGHIKVFLVVKTWLSPFPGGHSRVTPSFTYCHTAVQFLSPVFTLGVIPCMSVFRSFPPFPFGHSRAFSPRILTSHLLVSHSFEWPTFNTIFLQRKCMANCNFPWKVS